MATRPYGGRTREQRQARRRAELLEAALDTLAEAGADAVTVRGVCARARLNDRYFRESFRDIDEMLVAVLDKVTGDGVQVMLAAMVGVPDTRDAVRAAVEAALDYFDADPRRGRLVVESQATAALRARRHDFVRMFAQVVATTGRGLLGERLPPERESELAALTLVGGILELIATWFRGELGIDRADLADFLVAMILTTADISAALQHRSGGMAP